jgi:hypothetical protein
VQSNANLTVSSSNIDSSVRFSRSVRLSVFPGIFYRVRDGSCIESVATWHHRVGRGVCVGVGGWANRLLGREVHRRRGRRRETGQCAHRSISSATLKGKRCADVHVIGVALRHRTSVRTRPSPEGQLPAALVVNLASLTVGTCALRG